MKTTTLFALGALLGSVSFGFAQDGDAPAPAPAAPEVAPERPQRGPAGQRGQRGQREMTPEMRVQMEARRAQMQKIRTAMLAKFDEDQDGTFSADERAKVRAHVIGKFGSEGAEELTAEQRRVAMEAGYGWALGRGGDGQRPQGGEGRPARPDGEARQRPERPDGEARQRPARPDGEARPRPARPEGAGQRRGRGAEAPAGE